MATNAALATLSEVWTTLKPLGHSMAVMGGLSLAAWNYIRATRDVDLLVDVDISRVGPVLDVLRSRRFRTLKSPPILEVAGHHFVQLLYTPVDEFYDVQLDLLLAESELQCSAIARRVGFKISQIGQEFDVLRCDDLILFKLVAGRMIDRADVAMLLRENRDLIDWQYIGRWLDRLDLRTDFERAWSEAFGSVRIPFD